MRAAAAVALPGRRRPWARLGLAVVTVAATLSGLGVAGAALVGRAVPSLPRPELGIDSLEELVGRATSEPSTVYAADGTVLGRFQPEQLHTRIGYGDIPETLAVALVAAEDQRFWDHAGVDVPAVVRAALANGSSGEITQGGSTITQQLAKNLFTGNARTMERKLAELSFALELERRFSKEEILTAYANSTYFGNQAIGAEAAARTYFREPASELTLAEASLLAAVIPAPTTYDPRQDPDLVEQRRQEVLDRVAEHGLAPTAAVAEARARRPEVQPPLPAVEQDPYYLDYVRLYLLDVVGVSPQRLYGGGLAIHTALDPAVQDAATRALQARLPDPAGPSGAVAVVEPNTGAVLALVGGRDWEQSKVNLALGAFGGGSGRQPGSSFKPFVLATAFEQGWALGDTLAAPESYLPRSVPDPQPVRNYERRGYGVLTVAEATRRSVNTAFVGLTEAVGAEQVATVARRLGITDLPDPGAVGPSIGIGAYETSPLAMATAYAGFAADGRRVTPSPLRRIDVPPGTDPIDLPGAGPGEQVIAADSARLVTRALQGVIERGTATAAGFGRTAAAKTGTSDNHENAWLVGYTPQVAAAVWVGYPRGNVAMVNVDGVARVTGGSLPALIWRDVMAAAHAAREVADFPPAPDRPPGRSTAPAAPGPETGGTARRPPAPAATPAPPAPAATAAPAAPPARPSPALDAAADARRRVCERVPTASIC